MVSELRKGVRAHAGVRGWCARTRGDQHFVSVITLGEIRFGVERLRSRDRARTSRLETWLQQLVNDYGHRIIPVDVRVADQFGRLQARRTFPVADALMAATAKAYALTLVTRNEKDFVGAEIDVLNPFVVPGA